MTTSLLLVVSLTLMTSELTESIIYSGCRPLDQWAFYFQCNQSSITRVQDALFGAITDGGAVRDFCDNVRPNRTTECIPERNLNTRNLRLACNTVRGPCQPTGAAEIMTSSTFTTCGSYGFTYAYAVYECLSAIDSSGGAISYVYLRSSPEPSSRNSSEKVYLMSMNYDTRSYTDSPINQCSVTVSPGTSLRFRVLDLLGQTTAGPDIACPYTLYINSGTDYSREWCAELKWDYSKDYEYYIPASTGNNGLTVVVALTASPGSVSVKGRVWILVEGDRSDGSSATIVTSCGLTTSTTTTTTTTATTATTPVTTPTTSTTTTPTTTSTSTSSTPVTTPTTSTTTTPTTTSTSTSSSTTTTLTTTTTPTIATTMSTTTTPTYTSSSTTTTTTTAKLTPTTASTSTTAMTTTSTTISTTSSTTIQATLPSTGSTPTTTTNQATLPSTGSTPTTTASPGYTATTASSGSTNSTVLGYKEDGATNSNTIVGIAVGVSVGGVVVLCIIASITVCICIYYSNRKKRRLSSTRPSMHSAQVGSQRTNPLHTVSSSISNHGSLSPSVVSMNRSGTAGDDEIYSEINDATIGVTIIHKSNDPSTVEHQFSVRYTVGSPTTSTGSKYKDYQWQKRIKGRPPHLDDEAAWDLPPDSPPAYSDNALEQTARHIKRSKRDKNKLHIPPGDAGESDTDIQENPLYGMVQKKGDRNQEDYMY